MNGNSLRKFTLRCAIRGAVVVTFLLIGLRLFWPQPVAAKLLLSPPLSVHRQAMPTDDCPLCRLKERWWEWSAAVGQRPSTTPPPAGPLVYAAADRYELLYWQRMAYQASSGLNGSDTQIYFHNFAEPGYIVPLTTQGINTQPRLAPDTRRILFVSDRDKGPEGKGKNYEIYLINSDGSGEARLTDDFALDTMPAWSPDGGAVVFVSERDGNAEIYTMRADGGDLRRLTSSNRHDIYPNWSPDGTTIAWVQVDGEQGNLMVMNADGRNQRQLIGGLRYLSHPVWSPDGQQLAFDYDGNGDGLNEPYLLPASGGAPQLIATQDLGLDEWWIGSWLSNGDSILMTNLRFVIDRGVYVVDYILQTAVCIRADQQCDYLPIEMSTYANSPDIRSLDPTAPTVSLAALAPYTRMANDIAELFVTDRGPSGVESIVLGYRQPGESAWREGVASQQRGDRLFTPLPDAQNLPLGPYEFRVRAEDYAGNRSLWSSTVGRSFVYLKTATGQVTDNRGQPISMVGVTITPTPLLSAATDHDGVYRMLLDAAPQVTIEGVAQRDDGDLDYRHDFYHKPTDNQLANGDFELAGLNGTWRAAGALTPTLQSEIVAGDSTALRLGSLCTGLCLQRADGSPAFGEINTVAVDEQGVVHLVALVDGSDLTYWQRDSGGVWRAPELLYSALGIAGVVSAVNRQGELVVVWQMDAHFSAPLYLRERSADGVWTAAVKVASGQNPRLFFDDKSVWHLFYNACVDGGCSQYTTAHTYQLANGEPSSWSFPIAIENGYYDARHVALAVTPAGVVHLIYSGSGPGYGAFTVQHKRFMPSSAVWSTPQAIAVHNNSFCQSLFVDHQNALHLLCSGGMYISHMVQTPGNGWTAQEPLVYSNYAYDGYRAIMDSADRIHLVQRVDNNNGLEVDLHYIRNPDGALRRRRSVVDIDADPPHRPFGIAKLAAGPSLAVIGGSFDDYHLRETPMATGSADSSVAQSVTIPADLHQPTLSFFHAIYDATPTGESYFAATVTAGMTTTTVFSSTTNTDWRLGWADVSAWTGQTVTVTFVVSQAAGEPFLQAYLDEIALGAWTSPVVQSVTPERTPSGQTTTVTLQGVNFYSNLRIRLGSRPVNGVTVNETAGTATFTVAPTQPPGAYPIYLTAGDGGDMIYGGTLLVGDQLWLPLIAR
jgi:Tol biopolymer transport system component